jgi:hypothetical protein
MAATASLGMLGMRLRWFATPSGAGARTSFLYNGANAVQELSGSVVTANRINLVSRREEPRNIQDQMRWLRDKCANRAVGRGDNRQVRGDRSISRIQS